MKLFATLVLVLAPALALALVRILSRLGSQSEWMDTYLWAARYHAERREPPALHDRRRAAQLRASLRTSARGVYLIQVLIKA